LPYDAGARGARGAWGRTTRMWRHRRRRRRRWTRGSPGRSAALRGARPGSQDGCSARAGQGKWKEWRGCCVEGPLHCIVHLQRRNSSGSCAARGGREPRRPRASSGGVRRAARGEAGRRAPPSDVGAVFRCFQVPFRFQEPERTIEGAPGWPTARRRREARAVGPRTRRTPTRSRPCIPPGRPARVGAPPPPRRAVARGGARGSRSLRRRTAGARTRPHARSTCEASHMSVLRRHMGS
jgi:hypothetical protein